MNIKASEMHKGELAQIVEVQNSDLQIKLLEMGCTKGVLIRLTDISPLGCPLAFEMNGYKLGLRKTEADLLTVTKINNGE